MNPARRRAALALGLMLGGVGLAQGLKPRRRLAEMETRGSLEQLYPTRFGNWAVDDRTPAPLVAPDAQALLDKLYSQTLSRTYVQANTGKRIMLSVAYGGDQSDATRAHRPEVCYPSQGFQVSASRDVVLSLDDHPLRVRQLVTRLGGRHEPVTYWIVVGDRVALSGTDQKVAQLRYAFQGIVPDGMLVRVSNIDADAEAGFALQADFIRELARGVAVNQRRFVIGRAPVSR